MRRLLMVGAVTVCGALALTDFASRWNASATPSTRSTPAPSALLAQGHALFDSSCASCHGLSAQGVRGRAPSLHGAGALAADFYLQTGRMPLPSPRAQPLRTSPAFSQSKIDALVAYVASFGGPGIPTVAPRRGSLAEGQRLFGLDCAGCHSIQGQGGIVTGAIVPSLNEATPTQIGEAVRIGPYVMPRFGEGELSAAQVSSLARYIQSIQHPDDLGGWGIGRIGPIPEGMVAWLLAAAALLLIARLLGERTTDQHDPPVPTGRDDI
jgi:ubiquinol-cytochrome c reductase cytochrome c subunit